MRVFVTGISGQLGYEVGEELTSRGISCLGVTSKNLDVTNGAQVRRVLSEYKPDAVIHCAAYTQVDKAEEDRVRCWEVNADGTRYLAEAAKEIDAKLIYISTDYVFRGDGEKEYEVEDDVNPQNIYGLAKLGGELAVRSLLDRFFIVRTSWAYGRGNRNFIKSMLRLAETHKELSVVDDQIGSPTYMKDLAVLLCDMIMTEKYGIYHATNEGFCSRYEFAQEIFRVYNKDVKLIPVSSECFPSKAVRPKNSRMSKRSLVDAGFNSLPDWKDALRRYAALDGEM